MLPAKNIKEKISQYLWNYNGRTIRYGIGCAHLQMYGENPDMKPFEEARAILLKCYETGFRYYDTSRQYGDSELAVGEFIREIDRKTIFLATKANYNPRIPDGFEEFKRKFYDSFDRLHTDYIDLFQIHDVNNYGVCCEKIVPFLLERKKEGMIGYIGQGTRSLHAHILGVADGYIESMLSYLDYNLIKGSAQSAIAVAKKHDAAFINASVLMFGLMKREHRDFEEGKKFIGPVKWARELLFKICDYCDANNIDMVAAALQYSLLNPDIDITLNGIKRFSNLESTIRSMNTVIYPEQWAGIFKLQSEHEHFLYEDEGNYV